ncbi:MAG: hypothetical protein U0T75_16630 [Chitinophagales bacterium]
MPVVYSILYILYFLLFLWLIRRLRFFQETELSIGWHSVFFSLKALAGLGLTLIYTYYYTDAAKADIYRYFNDSTIISSLLWHHPKVWLSVITGIGINSPDNFQYLLNTQYFSHPGQDLVTSNGLIIRLSSLCNFLSFSNIYINTLFFSFLSFVGLTGLYNIFKKHFETAPVIPVVAFYLLPSVVFWGSGLLKEAPVFFFLGMLFYSFTRANRIVQVVVPLLCVLALLMLRPPLFVALIPAALVFITADTLLNYRGTASQLLGRRIGIALIWLIGAIIIGYNAPRVCEQVINKRNEFVELGLQEHPGSYFDASIEQADCSSFAKLLPKALVDGSFRPFIWSAANKIELLFGIEQTLLWLVLLLLLLRYGSVPTFGTIPVFLFCLVFAIGFYWLIGLTVPIMGAIVHYRVLATPFLVLGIGYLLNLQKFLYDVNRLNFFKKRP